MPDDSDEKYFKDGDGHAVIINKCPYDVWLWSVCDNTVGPFRIGCNEKYVEQYKPGGVALELVSDKSDWDYEDKKLVFYYKLEDGEVVYGLDGRYSNPCGGHKVVLQPEEPTCPRVYLEDGTTEASATNPFCNRYADTSHRSQPQQTWSEQLPVR